MTGPAAHASSGGFRFTSTPPPVLPRSALAALALGCAAVAPATDATAQQARALTASVVRNLGFGTILAGTPVTVATSDAVATAEVQLRGTQRAQVELVFTLPAALTGPGGTIPLTFGPSAAGYSAAQSIANQVPFDPRSPYRDVLANNGRASVYLGGTATPAAQQAPGTYTGVVQLSIRYTGL